MSNLAQSEPNVKGFTVQTANPQAFAAAVHATFPWRANRQAQMLAKNSMITFRALGDFSFTPADVKAVSELATAIDTPVEQKPVYEVNWYHDRKELPTKRDRSRRASSSKRGANSVRFGPVQQLDGGGDAVMTTPLQAQTIKAPEGQYNLLLRLGEKVDVDGIEAVLAEKDAKPGLHDDHSDFWSGYDAFFDGYTVNEMASAEEMAGWWAAWRDQRAMRRAVLQ